MPKQQDVKTISLKKACPQYGVTEEQCRNANICFHGSSDRVAVDDIINLKYGLQLEAKHAREKKMKEELGEEGFYKLEQEKEQEAARQKARVEQIPKIKAVLTQVMEFNATDPWSKDKNLFASYLLQELKNYEADLVDNVARLQVKGAKERLKKAENDIKLFKHISTKGWKHQEEATDKETNQKEQVPKIKAVLTQMMEVNANDPLVKIDGVKVATGVAKKICGATDEELEKCQSKKCGRSIIYDLSEIIKASAKARRSTCDGAAFLLARLKKHDNVEAKNQYASYLLKELESHEADLVEEAVRKPAECAKERLEKAENEIQLLKRIFPKCWEDEEEATSKDINQNDKKQEASTKPPKFPLQTKISKSFPGYEEPFQGTITSHNSLSGFYHIKYDDGDEEDLSERQVAACVKNKKRKAMTPRLRAIKPVVSPTPRKRRAIAQVASYKVDDSDAEDESYEDE